MRPRRFQYTLSALNATGYASNVTGATWTLSANSASDGLGHPVTIKNDSVTDHSAKTAVITGTDAEGNDLTETLNLPGTSATVTSLKYFKTVTSVVPSATIGADTMDIGWTAIAVTPVIVVDRALHGSPSLQVALGGTTCNFTIQHMVQDVFSPTVRAEACKIVNTVWTAAAAAGTTDLIQMGTDGATGMRVLVNSHTSGVLTVGFSQPMF